MSIRVNVNKLRKFNLKPRKLKVQWGVEYMPPTFINGAAHFSIDAEATLRNMLTTEMAKYIDREINPNYYSKISVSGKRK